MSGAKLQSNALNSRQNQPTSIAGGLKKMMGEGATRGQSEAKLLCDYAANKCQSEISLLLKSGSDPNVFARVDWQPFETTPLLEAAVAGHTRITRLLLEHGAKPDTVVGPGFTAIYNACMNGHFLIVRMLLEHGATVTTLTNEGFSPLYIACQNGHMDCAVFCLGASCASPPHRHTAAPLPHARALAAAGRHARRPVPAARPRRPPPAAPHPAAVDTRPCVHRVSAGA